MLNFLLKKIPLQRKYISKFIPVFNRLESKKNYPLMLIEFKLSVAVPEKKNCVALISTFIS